MGPGWEILPFPAHAPSEAVNVLSPACQSVERTWLGGEKQGQIATAFFLLSPISEEINTRRVKL